MDSNLKTLFNQASIMLGSLLKNSLDIFLLVFYKHFVYDKGT